MALRGYLDYMLFPLLGMFILPFVMELNETFAFQRKIVQHGR